MKRPRVQKDWTAVVWSAWGRRRERREARRAGLGGGEVGKGPGAEGGAIGAGSVGRQWCGGRGPRSRCCRAGGEASPPTLRGGRGGGGGAGLRKQRPLLDTPLEVHGRDDRTPRAETWPPPRPGVQESALGPSSRGGQEAEGEGQATKARVRRREEASEPL